MNRNELEQWMRESLQQQDFTPEAARWRQLQEALPPAPPKRKTLLLPVLPAVTARRAAAVSLLAAAAGGLWLVTRKDRQAPVAPPVAVHSPAVPAGQGTAISLPRANASVPVAAGQGRSPAKSRGDETGHYPNSAAAAAPVAIPVDPVSVAPDKQPFSAPQVVAGTPLKAQLPATGIAEAPFSWQPEDSRTERKLHFGVTAAVGNASVGNMQYQVGMVARTRFSGRLYAEATLALAATEVKATEQRSFQVAVIGSNMTNGTGSAVETRAYDVQAAYGRNVVSVGVAPALGYSLNARFSLSAGAAVYRNLAPSLALQNRDELEPAALSHKIISDEKTVSRWDASLTGSAGYSAGRRLSVQAQYRYGLSDYLYTNGRAVRNSGFSLGVRYLMGR